MKHIALIARLLLGLGFVVFGLNGFLNFMPVPPPSTEAAGSFIGAMYVSGYLSVVKGLEVLGGLLVLSGRFTALGLLILGPIVINIFLYHAFLDKAGLPISLVFCALSAFVLWTQRAAFRGVVSNG